MANDRFFLKAERVKITDKRLREILCDTAQPCPDGDYSPIDVYSIARELFLVREKKKKERKKREASRK